MSKLIFKSILLIFLLCSCIPLERYFLNQASPTKLVSSLDQKDKEFIKKEGVIRSEEEKLENWPPRQLLYDSNTLGYYLNENFKDFTSSANITNKSERNYIPRSILNDIDEEKLNAKAEFADISGKGVFFYIFNSDDRTDFNNINFGSNPTRIITVPTNTNYEIKTTSNLDNFIVSSTLRGYIDASIESGIEPPYSKIEFAAKRERTRNVSLVALYGSFVSPILNSINKDIGVLLSLWNVYKNNTNLIGNAYYLKEFNGIVGNTQFTGRDYNKLAGMGALNIRGPLKSSLKAQINGNTESESIFNATNWNTYINIEGLNESSRLNMFAKSPTPNDINERFSETNYHRHDQSLFVQNFAGEVVISFFVPNVPSSWINDNTWTLKDYSKLFQEKPRLNVTEINSAGSNGALFLFSCKPKQSIFQNGNSSKVFFDIRSLESINDTGNTYYIGKSFETDVTHNDDPVFRLRNNNQTYSFEKLPIEYNPKNSINHLKWDILVETASDEFNPVDFNSGREPTIRILTIKDPDSKNIDTSDFTPTIKENSIDETYTVTISYRGEEYDWNKINHDISDIYSLEASLEIPLAEGVNRTTNYSFKSSISFPIYYNNEVPRKSY